jgi:hypothetical protein
VLDAHADLLESAFNLTVAANRRLDAPWLLPTTAPQSGRYVLSQTALRAHSAARRWAIAIRAGHSLLEQRTDAVLQADVLRAGLVNETRRGAEFKADAADEPMRLDSTLWSIARENRELLDFLGALTSYNIAIANYALATLPAGVSNDELVKQLVVPRSTRRDS